MSTQTPSKLEYHKTSKVLDIVFANTSYHLSAEFLRVHSPSAEVKGHGPDQAVLQHRKKNIGIEQMEANGHYAIRISFDDGHDTGIYSWDYLHSLGLNQEQLWQDYLAALQAAGKNRDPDTQVLKLI